jgi:MraZ protein
MGFMGTHENRVDAKGRVSIPATFRAVLRGGAAEGPVTVVVRPSHKLPCLEGWPVDAFGKLLASLEQLPLFSDDYEDLATTLYAEANTVESDREGRIILPERLARHAGITDTVAFMGLGPSFRIWEPQAAERRHKQAAQNADARKLTLNAARVI